MEWYLKVLRQYADFEGRARRQEYWMFILINLLVTIFLAILASVFVDSGIGALFSILYLLYALGTMIPNLAVSVRRLHDVDKSGWMILISLIPLVGGILLLVWFATEGTHGSNQYGKDPKRSGDANDALFDDSDILDAGV